MRILLSIEHPAWAHQFRYLVHELESRGHRVKVVAIDKDRSLELLDKFAIPYERIADSTGTHFFEKVHLLFLTSLRIYRVARSFRPDLFLGRSSPMMALNAFLFRKPHLVYEDTECCTTCVTACRLFSSLIVTPSSFRTSLGKKQLRIASFKELFYLHPNYFAPDPAVLTEMGAIADERYVILRFTSWNASHDIGHRGLSLAEKLKLVNALERKVRVFISSEGTLPDALKPYALRISPERIHSALYYASLVIGEGASMASEAACLGTPALYLSPLGAGTLDEQELTYGLVYNFPKKDRLEKGLQKALELLARPQLRQESRERAARLMREKVDVNALFLDLIEKMGRKEPLLLERFLQPI